MTRGKTNGKSPADVGPRVGADFNPAGWREVVPVFAHNTDPFKWGRQGIWFVLWSTLDMKVAGVGKQIDGLWVMYVGRGGTRITARSEHEVIKYFHEPQQWLMERLTDDPGGPQA